MLHATVVLYTSCYGLCIEVYSLYVGVAVTRPVTNANLNSTNAIADYSFIRPSGNGNQLARCLTGLGPNNTRNGANGALGGLYFNGTMIPNSAESASCSSDVIQVRPGGSIAGLTNIRQCGAFSIAAEGVYTCTMMNCSMMNESVRFGIYISGRSESLYFIYPIT